MKTRFLLAAALLTSAVTYAAPASALNCPPGTMPREVVPGHNVCVPQGCDPAACPSPTDDIHCPTDIPVWTSLCTQIFGWD